mgnify:CR=1 FL=1
MPPQTRDRGFPGLDVRGWRRLSVLFALAAILVPTTACARSPRRGRHHGAGATSPKQLVTTYAPGTQARVLHLVDADTAWFEIPGLGRFKGRFYGLNAPECHKQQVTTRALRSARCTRDDEYFGLGAYRLALKLIGGQQVVLDCPRKKNGRCRTGGFGRILVQVKVGGVDVMEALVSQGAGWAFTKYPATNRATLCRLEDQARARGAGMWAGGADTVMAGMKPKTQKWYRLRAEKCAAAR